ncbi:MAG: EamA family transporter [Bacteroidota bacterium]|jgi:drug/metabolite transporter (DMT)-like permease|nr:EamA family transporter [Bacteroidota bacterium]
MTKFTLTDLPPLLLQGTRFLAASVMVGIYTWRDIKATTRTSLRAGLVLGVLLGMGFALQTTGLVETTASKAGFLTGTMVVFTPLLQMAIERRRPSVGNAIAVVIVGAGLYLFTSPAGGNFNVGDVLVLCCAVVFAFYIVYLDVFTKQRFDREIVFWQFIVTAAIGFIASPFFDESTPVFSAPAIGAVLYLALFASTIAIFVQSKYQRETTPTKAAIIFTMEPIFAAIIAYVALSETMGGIEMIGAVIMFAGLLFSELYAARISRTA